MNDEFYIGWQSQAATGIASHVRKVALALFFACAALAVALGAFQKTIGVAAFEWGNVKTFTGVLESKPYPHLLVQRPGQTNSQSAYYLVAPFKFGLNSNLVAALDGKAVTLKGTLIYRNDQTMIEAIPESIKPAAGQAASLTPSGMTNLGQQTFIGEIVDSKCYLGVMNPGRLTTHRACAVRCISGGIPPILLVRQENSPPLCLLLVGRDGQPVNKQVLDMVAEPVEITGDVMRQGTLWILRADPQTYRRAAK